MARLVIVDDEPDILFLLTTILEGAGFEVVSAPNGKTGMDLVRRLRPHALITDMMMPVMDGRELIRTIRDEPSTADLPILLISAAPDPAAGADAVLRKPFRPTELLSAVEDLIGRRAS